MARRAQTGPGEDRDKALRERLEKIIADYPQAEIARRTGRSRNALTRYARGAAMPLEFGTALVESFGVNPAWLLTGDSTPYLSDVPEASSELGRELLELVGAMAGVSRMRVGSLSGKRHAKALREVSDALDLYGSLQARLNGMTAPVLRDLLDQLHEAIRTRDMAQARALESMASRVQRMCDDNELTTRFLGMRVHVLHSDLRIVEALETQELYFQRVLASGADFRTVAPGAYNLAVLNSMILRMLDARRACRLAMAAAEGDDARSAHYLKLLCQDALADIELGELAASAAKLQQAAQICTPDERTFFEPIYLHHALVSGAWSVHQLDIERFETWELCFQALRYGVLLEDRMLLKRVISRAGRFEGGGEMQRQLIHRAEMLLRILESGVHDNFDDEGLIQSIPHGPPREFARHVYRAQTLRICGQVAAGERSCLEAQTALEAVSGRYTPSSLMVILHLRNVLLCVDERVCRKSSRELKAKTQVLRQSMIDSGYGIVRSLC